MLNRKCVRERETAAERVKEIAIVPRRKLTRALLYCVGAWAKVPGIRMGIRIRSKERGQREREER